MVTCKDAALSDSDAKRKGLRKRKRKCPLFVSFSSPVIELDATCPGIANGTPHLNSFALASSVILRESGPHWQSEGLRRCMLLSQMRFKFGLVKAKVIYA